MKYYSLKRILSKNAIWNLIIGERSNGKTYAVLERIVTRALTLGEDGVIIRRWAEDFKNKRGATMFASLVNNGVITKLSNGEWDNIYYFSGRWYFCRTEDGKRLCAEEPFCYAFALTDMEHDKSTSYPKVKTILFDEFLSRFGYLPDEFILLSNVLSTIIRDRDDVLIFMCGNTVNKYSPYFVEMGLTNIQKMEKGEIQVYDYGDSGLKVAVEFTDTPKLVKKSNKYFAFNNPRLEMITGKGNVWEIAIYPHLTFKYVNKDIKFIYFIEFNDNLLQCEVIKHDKDYVTYIHKKTTPLKSDREIVFSPEADIRCCRYSNILKPVDSVSETLGAFFKRNKVFYQNNEIGEIVNNYLMYCKNKAG